MYFLQIEMVVWWCFGSAYTLVQIGNLTGTGILVGYTFRNLTIPLYTFSPFNKNRYFILGLSVEWAKAKAKAKR